MNICEINENLNKFLIIKLSQIKLNMIETDRMLKYLH